ncbi:MAG: ribosome silencing factor [Elusimicrobia bacterium RIFCSPHIGHO2_02_FULL_57_9]|nr:MAG: ribosome silencing factor [Elusimicrobia bacterium RIFCSPHIGHO2_02_FULL_57_9]
MARSFKTAALAAAQAADDKKGEDIALLNIGRISPLADYMLIVTANSGPHLDALETEIDKALGNLRLRCLHHSRPRSEHWQALDYGGLLIHLMTEEARDFYGLDKLYHNAPPVAWQERKTQKV